MPVFDAALDFFAVKSTRFTNVTRRIIRSDQRGGLHQGGDEIFAGFFVNEKLAQ
jgi:hypothetical protein